MPAPIFELRQTCWEQFEEMWAIVFMFFLFFHHWANLLEVLGRLWVQRPTKLETGASPAENTTFVVLPFHHFLEKVWTNRSRGEPGRQKRFSCAFGQFSGSPEPRSARTGAGGSRFCVSGAEHQKCRFYLHVESLLKTFSVFLLCLDFKCNKRGTGIKEYQKRWPCLVP